MDIINEVAVVRSAHRNKQVIESKSVDKSNAYFLTH